MDENQFIEMVPVKGGIFIMGCTDDSEMQHFPEEGPAREVTLSDFYIGKYPVTQQQWEKVMGYNPGQNKSGNDLPVENVSWLDVQEFIEKLNKKTGKKYALPTEAQWEFAAKGGTRSQGFRYSGSNDLNEFGWYAYNSDHNDSSETIVDINWYHENSNHKTKPVGLLKANELGLFDMSGNVSEWCRDWFGPYDPADINDPAGPLKGSERVYRGGSFNAYPKNLRTTFRSSVEPDYAHGSLGFRLVLLNEPLPENTEPESSFVKIDIEMVDVKGGTFIMGAPEDDEKGHENALPRHEVTLSDYSIGKYPVTQKQWQQVMGKVPVDLDRFVFKGNSNPVTFVSRDDVDDFIRRLNQITGKNYTLPTEAQWEFAARGKKKTKLPSFSMTSIFGIDKQDSKTKPQPVGSTGPNKFGIYDMIGNVSEWCKDCYYKYTQSPKINPVGPRFPSEYVYRGGPSAKTYQRNGKKPDEKNGSLGFRLAINRSEKEK
jgi:formylglycine-generating enzyme required for sulfatase activity